MCLSCYTITAVWLVCSEMLCNLFTFFQVNWDKELLYRDFSLISCHLYCHFLLPFWIEALNGLWMIQEGIVCSWIDLYRYTACSLTCERSKLSRGWYYLLLMTVGAHDYCRFMNIENFAESLINYSNSWSPWPSEHLLSGLMVAKFSHAVFQLNPSPYLMELEFGWGLQAMLLMLLVFDSSTKGLNC